jgi:DNA-binding NarL/FixJ family response regulator
LRLKAIHPRELKGLEFWPVPTEKGTVDNSTATGRETIAICSDRDFLMLALERITAARFLCERHSCNRVLAMDRALASDYPAAVIADVPQELLKTFTRSLRDVPIIAWQRSAANEPSLNALDLGVAGVLNDVSTAEDVIACLGAVTAGRRWVPPSVTEAGLNTTRCHLSRREGQLLKLIAMGLRNKEIAYALCITEGTVKVYLSRLFSKVGVADRYELALLGLRHSGHESSEPPAQGGSPFEALSTPLDAVYIHRTVPHLRPN